jgi:uncharacterized HAD superfamily protein
VRIGLDLDGVIYPWHWSIYRYFTEFKGFEGTQREFWEYIWTLPKDIQHYYVMLPMMYNDTSPTVDVQTYLPKLAELGDIYYITARDESLYYVTRKFFEFWNLPFKENVVFTDDKPSYVRLLNIDFFLDDRDKHVDELIGLTDVYLFKAVHNWKVRDNYRCLNTLKEYYEIVKEKHG